MISEQHAIDWWDAECAQTLVERSKRAPKELCDPLPAWTELSEERRQEIREHVEQLFSGAIPRNKLSTADWVAFHGRYRMATRPLPKGATRRTWWDFCDLGYYHDVGASSGYLFSGAGNIGAPARSNLMVPGCLTRTNGGCGTEYVATGWHLSTTYDPELLTCFERLLASGFATFSEGNRELGRRRLSDLWRGAWPLDERLQEYGQCSVLIEFHEPAALHDLFKKSANRDPERFPPGFWINIEGYLQPAPGAPGSLSNRWLEGAARKEMVKSWHSSWPEAARYRAHEGGDLTSDAVKRGAEIHAEIERQCQDGEPPFNSDPFLEIARGHLGETPLPGDRLWDITSRLMKTLPAFIDSCACPQCNDAYRDAIDQYVKGQLR